MPTKRLSSLALLVGTAVLSACGSQPSGAATADGGDEPVTASALAFVAAEYAGQPDHAFPERDPGEFAKDAVAAELRYGSDGEYDGDMLRVRVATQVPDELRSPNCAELIERVSECEVTDRGLLLWEDEHPEEDPGVVYALVSKGRTTVFIVYSGPAITDDPRQLDLPISVETLFDIANDPRVDMTTSRDAVDAGERLDFWQARQ